MPLIPSLNGRIINHFEGWILEEEGRDKCSHHSVFQSLKMDSFSQIFTSKDIAGFQTNQHFSNSIRHKVHFFSTKFGTLYVRILVKIHENSVHKIATV